MSAEVPIRRDGEGRLSGGPSWEGIAERLIREAMERGEFDDLPYRGQPLPPDDDSLAGENRLAFHVLRNAGVAPPWIEADKEVRRQLEIRDGLLAQASQARTTYERDRLRKEMARTVHAANDAIAMLNAEAPSHAQHRRPLRPDAEMAELERRMAGDEGTEKRTAKGTASD